MTRKKRRVEPTKLRITKKKSAKITRGMRGMMEAFLPAEIATAGVQPKRQGKKPGGGRGRPAGTYKTRYVPGVGAVKVPTHIYNKMMAEAKAKRRLAEAKRQAMYQQAREAEQIAMQTDPRYAPPTAEDIWADEPDMDHETEIARIKQQQLLQQQMQMQRQAQPSLAQRGVRGVVDQVKKISLMGSQRERLGGQFQTQEPSYARPQLDIDRHRPREPRVSILGGKANLFGNQNLMNQRNEIPIKKKTNLMNQRNELF